MRRKMKVASIRRDLKNFHERKLFQADLIETETRLLIFTLGSRELMSLSKQREGKGKIK